WWLLLIVLVSFNYTFCTKCAQFCIEWTRAAACPKALLHSHATMVMIMVIDYPGSATMQTIQASESKARCLALMDQVAASGEILVVTKNGKPVAKLNPFRGARALSPFGLHPGVRILGDIVSPVADEDWEALS